MVEHDVHFSGDSRYMLRSDHKFIHLQQVVENQSTPINSTLEYGWKLHIGVHWEDIPLAWNLIKNTIMDHNLYHAKFMLKETAQQEQISETEQIEVSGQGREITI